ncbi:hypothetical protein CPB84DRAFT_1767412 [Gymnopilus junonius]|uniref:Uncharacterized protein n=1 Tax=Gymnopilus junonius TaxID=109634 RepID=A0A9P5NYI4_GYMJU|nr:hypothetical protein CPB84DRAFT_1767412 [Gymnopilus junonius]
MERETATVPVQNPVITESESPSQANTVTLIGPCCFGQEELSNAVQERARVATILRHNSQSDSESDTEFKSSPLFTHLAHGLAYTVGSALGSTPPSIEACLAAYLVPNNAGLTAGSRAWSKHSHRSQPPPSDEAEKAKRSRSTGWWGITSGPVAVINEKSLALFWKVINNATWRNLHWLPHQVLVYEVRVPEGYGMRWSQDQGDREGDDSSKESRPWTFRGFVEPMMENGHEVKWRHAI